MEDIAPLEVLLCLPYPGLAESGTSILCGRLLSVFGNKGAISPERVERDMSGVATSSCLTEFLIPFVI